MDLREGNCAVGVLGGQFIERAVEIEGGFAEGGFGSVNIGLVGGSAEADGYEVLLEAAMG